MTNRISNVTDWVEKNILAIITGIIVLIIGWFSFYLAIKSEISCLERQVVEMKVEMRNTNRTVDKLDNQYIEIDKKLDSLEKKIDKLNWKNNIVMK